MLQPGTGTTDWFAYANYIVAYRRFGLSLNGSLKLAGQNHYRESMAAATTQFANLFYIVPLGQSWKLIPSAQLYYEYTKGQKQAGELTGEHAMNNALLGPGLDLYFKNVALNTAVQLPVYNHGAADHPQSAGRAQKFAASFDPTARYQPALSRDQADALFDICTEEPGKPRINRAQS